MSMDKSINNGKDKRRQYRRAKAIDKSCRNHGDCSWCEDTRTHNARRQQARSEYDCNYCWDTGCDCGEKDCQGCCSCIREINMHGRTE